MHRSSPALLLLVGLACRPAPLAPVEWGAPVDLVSRVDPKIGTGGLGFAVGSGYPGAAWPFAMVRLSPDTADAFGASFGSYRGGGYHADDRFIQGFSHLHLNGVGLTDYGLIAVMPHDGMTPDSTTEAGYRAAFAHDESVARPGFYTVTLHEPEIGVELAATPRTGLHRYTFSDAVERPTLIFDLGHLMDESVVRASEIRVDPVTGHLSGWLREDGAMATTPFTVWFEAEVSPPPVAVGVWDPDGYRPGDTTGGAFAAQDLDGWALPGARAGAWLEFDAREVRVQVAISFTDAAGAAANLAAEAVPDLDPAVAAEAADAAWREWLAPVQVWGGTEADQVKLATGLYKTLLMPHAIEDVDGRYRGFDAAVHTVDQGHYATDLSLWDTYRTTHPLYTLLWPDAHRSMLRSLARMAEQGGALPKWPLALWDGGFMVGSPAMVVIGEAAQKGLTDFDEDVLFAKAADMALGRIEAPYGGRPDVSVYDTYGYYPSDLVGTSVSWTQEVCLADYALAAGGARHLSAEDRDRLAARAGNWRALYDPAIGFFHAKDSAGVFQTLRSEAAWADEFSEGNARHYLWLVPHDLPGLWETLGGEEVALARLEDFFAQSVDAEDEILPGTPKPWFWAGNEHDLQVPFLFSALGRPDLSAQWAGWTLDTFYGLGADGYPGNDDGGAMGAWVVWAELGLYPLAGTDQYLLSDSRFPLVEITLPGGIFTIRRSGSGPVTRIELNGRVLDPPVLRHADLQPGAALDFIGADP